jgi:hypothetical protein
MTQKKVTIADILHLAADKYLASDWDEIEYEMGKDKFSCCAIEQAAEDLLGFHEFMFGEMHPRILDGLKAMGLDTGSLRAFAEWEYRDPQYDTQHARYGWLKLAALMAEEQGV